MRRGDPPSMDPDEPPPVSIPRARKRRVYVPAERLQGAIEAFDQLSVVLNDVTASNADRVARAKSIVREARNLELRRTLGQ